MKKRVRYQGLTIFVMLIIVILGGKFIFASYKNSILDYFTDMLGIFFVFVGFSLRISARGYKEEKSKCGEVLVEDGPYELLRHPMYLGIFLIGLGVVLVIFKLWVFFLFLLFLIFYLPQIIREEKELSLNLDGSKKNYLL